MALFEVEHYGKPISPQLSEILKGLIERKHILKVCEDMGMSYNSVWVTICGNQNLTKRNGHAIKRLMQMAYENAVHRQKEDGKSINVLRKLLKLIK